MPLHIVVGTQWGDEGKGRVVDLLSASANLVARYNGGDNAGHTVTVGQQTFKLHLLPSGIIHSHTTGVIGNGVVINPDTLLSEIESLRQVGIEVNPQRLRISHAAHIITPAHRALDQAQENARGLDKIGTTLRGIGPVYTDKVTRSGIRVEKMLSPEDFADAIHAHVKAVNHNLVNLYGAEPLDPAAVAAEMVDQARQLIPYIGEISLLLANALKNGQHVLAEGAQGSLLDLDHGTYPFVTSSTPTAPGALVGLGLGVGYVERVIGVTKSFQTRVGEGGFTTELAGDLALRLRGTGEKPWDEYGTTTGRPRRVGWLDMVLLRYAARVNGLTELALTKLDILSGINPLRICTAYRSTRPHTSDPGPFEELPLGPADLVHFEPIYEELPGWEKDLTAVQTWEELPEAARQYILRIEELSSVPVRTVSVGPERHQIVEITE